MKKLILLGICLLLAIPSQAGIIYVDANASGANTGSSWADAYQYLGYALDNASSGDDIHVAQGIYRPSEGYVAVPDFNWRTTTFQLKNGVTLKGSYAGFDEPDPNARDVKVYKTILSGDLNGDDVGNLEDHSRAENSYHVVTAIGANETTLLDGFTITGGNANGSTADNRRGGGLHISQSTDLTLTNCTFATNSAGGGGGLYNDSFNLMLTNCTFIGNSAGSGGGMELHGDQTTLINCIFSGNSAINGGGIDCPCTEVSLTNCTFVGNTASSEYNYRGGGICGDDDTVMRLTNCIFWANRDIDGMGQAAQIDHDSFPQTHVNFCCIQGWTGDLDGTGNFGDDPLFVDPNNDDYHLLEDSPCIDAGDPNYIPEPNETDLDGKLRVIGGRIDMGAYESPVLAEARIVPRTINLASKGKWITAFLWLPEEYNVADIEPNSVLLEGEIKPEEFSVDQQKQVAVLRFSRKEVQGILDIGEVELSIIGWLTDRTLFEGRDVIRVINKEGGGKPDKYVQASDPNPPDGVTVVGINADLSWISGPYVTSHDVYFGTSSLPPFVCNQTDTTFDPGTMADNTKYYWRIDEVNKWGKTIGEVWSFTIMLSPPPPPPPPPP